MNKFINLSILNITTNYLKRGAWYEKKKKIQYLFLVCIIMTAFVFSGCGSKKQNEAPKGDNSSATQEAEDVYKRQSMNYW